MATAYNGPDAIVFFHIFTLPLRTNAFFVRCRLFNVFLRYSDVPCCWLCTYIALTVNCDGKFLKLLLQIYAFRVLFPVSWN